MSDSGEIDQAILAKLLSDAQLTALLPDGVYWDVGAANAKQFAVVSLLSEADESVFGGRAIEDGLYLVKAVGLGSVGGNIAVAAARIDALLEDQPLTVPGYTWMTTFREERVRIVEIDELDRAIRWYHRGGHYRVRMSVG